LNLAGPLQKPVILVGDHFLKRCDLTALLRLDGASCDRVLLYKAKSVEEAVEYAESYFAELATRRYVSPAFYPALSPDDILKHILRDTRSYDVLFERIELTVFPGVFPSHRFRASRALGTLARQISTGKRILDVGCGPGAIGLVALTNGAQSVTFSDLSPAAVKNTAYNVERHGYAERTAIYEGDLFDNIPFGEKFDIIYFNPPFHMEARRDEATSSVLFGGKRQEVVAQFLSEAKQRLAPSGHILMCFSNKDRGSLNAIERMFEQYEYRSELLVHRDASTGADVRIYRLCGQQRSRVGSGRIEPAAL
jgi:release factor glutamine methyltransferase